MTDKKTANDVAKKIFALIVEDNRLMPDTHPNEIVTIAMQLIITVLKNIAETDRREYAIDLIANKIRDMPDIWKDKAKVVLH